MMCTLSRWLLPAALCAAGLAVQAQSATPPKAAAAASTARPDPLDAQASVPALNYRSAFSGFRPLGDDKTISWRDANNAVARIGGWRVYAREAQEPAAAPPAAAPSAAAAPAAAPPASAPPAATPTAASPSTPTPAAPVIGPDAARPMQAPAGHGGHKTP